MFGWLPLKAGLHIFIRRYYPSVERDENETKHAGGKSLSKSMTIQRYIVKCKNR